MPEDYTRVDAWRVLNEQRKADYPGVQPSLEKTLAAYYPVYRDQVERTTKPASNRDLQYFRDERFLTLFGLEAINQPKYEAIAAHAIARAKGRTTDGVGPYPWRFNTLMSLAFGPMFTGWGNGSLKSHPTIVYERNLKECLVFRDFLRRCLANSTDSAKRNFVHPVLPRRDACKSKARLEGPTQVDAVIERVLPAVKGQPCRKAERVYVESKFLSDISVDVTYCPVRNQIARVIEAGLQDVDFELERFWFLLISPRVFKVDHPNSRLYSHLMRVYRSDPSALRADLVHLEEEDSGPLRAKTESQRVAFFRKLAARIAHICWEDVRSAAGVDARATPDDFTPEFRSMRDRLSPQCA